MVQCPECTSQKVWKDGIRYAGEDRIQRFLCRSCGHRFSDGKVKVDVVKQGRVLSDSVHDFGDLDLVNVAVGDVGFQDSAFTVGKDVGSHDVPIVGKTINSFLPNSREHRVCASEAKAAKNLVEVETVRDGLEARQATKADIKGKIVEYAWWLKKEGYADSTVHVRSRNLRRLAKLGANIYDPESVKETIANQTSWSVSSKANIVDAYHTFTRMLGVTWTPPRYKHERSFPFIPTEAEIDQLIASCGNKTATFLQTLKETGMRAGEAYRLEWVDIDTERRLINLRRPEKGSNPRIFKVSQKLIDMLNSLSKKSKRVFGDIGPSSLRVTFCASRKKAAKKLANPRLLQIHFHTLRHWKATIEYHKTKDPYHVKQLLGHKSLRNTELYINLEQAIFSEGDNSKYTTRIAKTIKGARALLAAGFEYVTDMDGYKLFRKRK